MLERENIDNFIADDLALRNRNWGQIEDELAEKATVNTVENGLTDRYTKAETDTLLNEKATVTELTDGLEARYTKDETDGLLTEKADKSKVPAETGLQTVAGKNQFYPVAQDNTGRITGIHQDNIWNGSDWVSTDNNGVGLQAMGNNTGPRSNGVGDNALQNNTGTFANGVGFDALRYNTGNQCNGFGLRALERNTGLSSNGVGYFALQNNTGEYSTGQGYFALRNNTGNNGNGVGAFVMRDNTGSNNSAFGHQANTTTDEAVLAFSNTTCLGAYTLPNRSNQVVLGDGNVDTVKMGGTARTPASSTDVGVKGETCWDTDYFYVCVATNIWKRIKMEVW